MEPRTLDKYRYIRRTPTWLVRIFYAVGILTWLPIVYMTFVLAEAHAFAVIFVAPIIALLSVQYLGSFVLGLQYKQFDLAKHFSHVKAYWKTHTEPAVDVFLPICGEDLQTLAHTWQHVAKLAYQNKKVYVLDDSAHESREHRAMAEAYGFTHIERPNKGEMKKAGNLKYAFGRTHGDYIAILDADFAPHPDFLRELVPYMDFTNVGIVQSPQYFETSKELHRREPLGYGGARAQEVFYRILQVARDRIGGTHCCGTCALYRRAALESIGGFVQMGHSEDAHTGLGLNKGGWRIKYVPVILSIGISPNDPHAFFHQQHRWCMGNMVMMLDPAFWKAKIPWRTKYAYATGFMFYLHQPFLLLYSFQLFILLYFYNHSVHLVASIPFYPHILWAFLFMFLLYDSRFRWGYLYALILRMYTYCHAVGTVLLGQSVGWIPTNAKHLGLSSAFRQMVKLVALYVAVNLALIAIGLRRGLFHPFNYNYFSLQLWIFYNFILSALLLLFLYHTVERTASSPPSMHPQKFSQRITQSTNGKFAALAFMFLGITYTPLPAAIAPARAHESDTAKLALAAKPLPAKPPPSNTDPPPGTTKNIAPAQTPTKHPKSQATTTPLSLPLADAAGNPLFPNIQTFPRGLWKLWYGQMSVGTSTLEISTKTSDYALMYFVGGARWQNYQANALVNWRRGKQLDLLARFQNSKNYETCQFSQNGSFAQAYEVHNGTETILKRYAPPPHKLLWWYAYQNVGVRVNGRSITCLINGTPVLSATTTPALAYGSIGFKVYGHGPGNAEMVIRGLSIQKR